MKKTRHKIGTCLTASLCATLAGGGMMNAHASSMTDADARDDGGGNANMLDRNKKPDQRLVTFLIVEMPDLGTNEVITDLGQNRQETAVCNRRDACDLGLILADES